MSFISILLNEKIKQENARQAEIPPFFIDLNLDQIVDAITEKWEEYDLKPIFYFSLDSIDAIKYRHEVFRDLENALLYEYVKVFTGQMIKVRNHLTLVEKLYYKRQKEIWFLYAVEIYCNAVNKFKTDLSSTQLDSRGFLAFREYLTTYTENTNFKSLVEEVSRLKAGLGNVRYRIIIQDNSFTVQNYEPGIDYSAEIETTFEKFKQGAVKDYLVKYDSISQDMNHIEAQILDFVAQLNSDLFSRLKYFNTHNKDFIDETISIFDREIHFYISYLEHIKKFKGNEACQPAENITQLPLLHSSENGNLFTEQIDSSMDSHFRGNDSLTNSKKMPASKLQFCYPKISDTSPQGTGKEIYDYEGFDLALAQKLNESNDQLVCNDFYLKDKERIIVVTGPNQGGKTTFARMFGQLHYLASLGCPVPGREAKLFLFDNIFTQFERAEKVENLRGKLEDDLTRIHYILEEATSRSIIIMNEIFNSTTIQDVSFLSTKIMEKILGLDLLCVWVTFIDELASFSEQTVSMTSTVVPENPAMRTFKIVRRPADGLAYALAIAEKYRLTYSHIKERIKS